MEDTRTFLPPYDRFLAVLLRQLYRNTLGQPIDEKGLLEYMLPLTGRVTLGVAPQGSHRSGRARLTHPVPQVTFSLRHVTHGEPCSAIRCRRVDTVPGFSAPAMFPSNGYVTRRPASLHRVLAGRVPLLQRYYRDTTTSCRPSRRAFRPPLTIVFEVAREPSWVW